MRENKGQEVLRENVAPKVMEAWLVLRASQEIPDLMVFRVNLASKARTVNLEDWDCVGQVDLQV